MDNRIRRIRVGAWLLSAWFVTLIVLIVLLMMNIIIELLSGYSPIDSSPSTISNVLSGAFFLFLFLGTLIGTFFVTAGAERVKSIAAANIARLLSRGFCVLFILAQGLILFDDLALTALDSWFQISIRDAAWSMLEALLPVSWVCWAVFTALYYVWLNYEFGFSNRKIARRQAKLLFYGGVSIAILMLLEFNSTIFESPSRPRSIWPAIARLLLTVVTFITAAQVCSLIIGLPYTMKKQGIGAASVTADRPRP